jgi:putative hydroxymethylpyrimidine transport system ATP-binding protein
MKQRASFARTLLSGADLMLLDEPFSALDSITRMGLQEWLLDEWQKHKKTVLFVTHDVEEAIFLSKKIFIITDRPVSHFEECKVPLSYPRNRDDMKRSDIGDMKAMLIKKLRQEAAV